MYLFSITILIILLFLSKIKFNFKKEKNNLLANTVLLSDLLYTCNEMIDNYSEILFDKKYNKVIVERMSIEWNIRKKVRELISH